MNAARTTGLPDARIVPTINSGLSAAINGRAMQPTMAPENVANGAALRDYATSKPQNMAASRSAGFADLAADSVQLASRTRGRSRRRSRNDAGRSRGYVWAVAPRMGRRNTAPSHARLCALVGASATVPQRDEQVPLLERVRAAEAILSQRSTLPFPCGLPLRVSPARCRPERGSSKRYGTEAPTKTIRWDHRQSGFSSSRANSVCNSRDVDATAHRCRKRIAGPGTGRIGSR